MLGKNFSRQHFEMSSYFSQETDLTFHVHCLLRSLYEMSKPIFFFVKSTGIAESHLCLHCFLRPVCLNTYSKHGIWTPQLLTIHVLNFDQEQFKK